jgi:hypothetical protein
VPLWGMIRRVFPRTPSVAPVQARRTCLEDEAGSSQRRDESEAHVAEGDCQREGESHAANAEQWFLIGSYATWNRANRSPLPSALSRGQRRFSVGASRERDSAVRRSSPPGEKHCGGFRLSKPRTLEFDRAWSAETVSIWSLRRLTYYGPAWPGFRGARRPRLQGEEGRTRHGHAVMADALYCWCLLSRG